MTDRETFMLDLIHFGASATVTAVTGTACGCVAARGSSREWHRLNPTETDCNGTGLVDTTVTATPVRAIFSHRLQSLATFLAQYRKVEIGELDETDLLMFGTAKASDASFYDLSGMEESSSNRGNKVTFQSADYSIRHVYSIYSDSLVGQVALLKEKAA